MYLFLHNNGELGALSYDGDFKPIRSLDPVELTFDGRLYQDMLPWLRNSIDMTALAANLGLTIQPGFERLQALSRAAEYVGAEVRHPDALGRGMINLVRSRMDWATNTIASLEEADLEYARTWLNPRYRVLNSCKSFKLDGNKRRVRWMLAGTSTGRTRIESCDDGFNPLNFPKDDRKRVTSVTPGHVIVQVDFKALEFRLAMQHLGVKNVMGERDPYDHVSKLIGLKGPRSERKNALIATLYGKKIRNIQLPDEEKANLLIWYSKVVEPNRKKLIEKCYEDVEDHGYFRTPSGRRVYEEGEIREQKIINNYFQSYGADVVLKEFANMLDEFSDFSAYPIFCIHDSMVLSMPHDEFEWVSENVTKLGEFPVEWSLFAV